MRRNLLLLLSLILFLGGLSLGGSSPASARCVGWKTGQANGYWSYGAESSNGNQTCDRDKYYAGRAAEDSSSQGDGHCAVVRGRKSGGSWVWLGYSCANNNNFRNYGWNVGARTGELKMCHGWNSGDCSDPEDSWSM